MTDLESLYVVLEASVARSERALTNAHLLSIVKMAIRMQNKRQEAVEVACAEVLDDDAKWGSS